MISFIIPAHNEEALIGETLRILRTSAEQLDEPFEIIVVDDSSTDRTTEIARSAGATVESVHKRQIGAVRNAGAKVARGEVLFFVDADTHVPPTTLRQAMDALRGGAIGGGSRFRFASVPAWARLLEHGTGLVMRALDWAAGCFLFARRDAFEAVGGFDERYYATEELVLSMALKRRGKMVIVDEPVITSGRKAHLYTPAEAFSVMFDILFRGRSVLRRREGLHFWYDGRR